MTVFEEVKNNVNILDVAKVLGLQLSRSNMCCCPFHNEKTASFSISEKKQIFKCFGCGITGDAISLTELICNLKPLEAVTMLNNQFNLCITINDNTPTKKYINNEYEQNKKGSERLIEKDKRIFNVLCDYLHQMTPVEYMQYGNIVEYYIDMFIYGNREDLKWFRKNEERWWKGIEARLRRNATSTSN